MVQVVVNGGPQGHHPDGGDQGLVAKMRQQSKPLLRSNDATTAAAAVAVAAANNANSNSGENGSNNHRTSHSDNERNGSGGGGGGGGGGKGGGRKLTKNEKRRQKNKQRKAEAHAGTEIMESMNASNGVAVASWPPPAEKDEAADAVQVRGLCMSCGFMLCVPSFFRHWELDCRVKIAY